MRTEMKDIFKEIDKASKSRELQDKLVRANVSSNVVSLDSIKVLCEMIENGIAPNVKSGYTLCTAYQILHGLYIDGYTKFEEDCIEEILNEQ